MAHAAPKTASTDRVKLPFTFDAEKMLAEFEALKLQQFEYYNVIPLRAPAHTVDTSLPFPPPADDYADGSWCDWMDTDYLKSSPYLNEVIDTFKAKTKVTLVRLLRLAPNSVVQQHTDPTLGLEVHKSVIRLTVPILNKEGIQFFLNDTEVPMQPGECWYLRLTDPHRVINNGNTERVNLTIDMIPNDWIREIIKESDQ
ncbi:aspartyl/asparaginyl beta-hydroxylase [Kordia periserrulae]|uniref:Aspartyl/asparaginyl beta-hydroxylase n=1 Tax=Kordia periserrulae TaxID=701523 RepID=A0A2T6C352_9FLAO|nr:aspartyl/asparaginyl beta-hydroxylase domain-containing protein [Kordia periserrulae]PTX62749.1 aspartyl/asparaginyl beta-hydroxylase [Kordia periserrulae]